MIWPTFGQEEGDEFLEAEDDGGGHEGSCKYMTQENPDSIWESGARNAKIWLLIRLGGLGRQYPRVGSARCTDW